MGRSKIAAVRQASLAGAVPGPSCAAASAAFAPQPLRARHTRGVAFTSLEPYTGECLAASFPEGLVRRVCFTTNLFPATGSLVINQLTTNDLRGSKV